MDEISALRTVLVAEQILETCDAVAHWCNFFWQSVRFEPTIVCQKIGTILSLHGKMVWTHWTKSLKFDLKEG
jgi:hypothetical protein